MKTLDDEALLTRDEIEFSEDRRRKYEVTYMNDSEIITLFEQRNERAISAASEKYGKYCMAVAMNILKNHEDAEECMNDALMRAWEKIPPSRPDNFAGFLAKITKNISINRYNQTHAAKRGNGEVPMILDELSECVSDNGNVERAFEQKELISAVNNFLKEQKQEKRDIFY